MGAIFDLLKKMVSGKKTEITINSNNPYIEYEKCYKEGVCPGCKIKLDTIPAVKKRCKECNNLMVVRVNPITKERLLITEDAAKNAFDLDKK